jgi:hypothetical protein
VMEVYLSVHFARAGCCNTARGGRHSYAIQIGHNILYVNATAFF